MSVHATIRIPDDLISMIDYIAERDGTTRSVVILGALRASLYGESPAVPQTTPRARRVARAIPAVKPASAIVAPQRPPATTQPGASAYSRPAHAETCKCGICLSR